jgi:DNA-binding response OmpR family regulator
MNVLLIARSSEPALALRDLMEEQQLSCMLRRIEPGNGATAYVRRSGIYQKITPPDLILFDFTSPDAEQMSLLKSIAFGPKRAPVPVIILTRGVGERSLDRDGILDSYSTMFAPTELSCFLTKMREHRRRRFLRALEVMYELGPILVRSPRLVRRVARIEPLLAETA